MSILFKATRVEIQRRAWERGSAAGIFAQAYGGLEYDESGDILAPDGILSGEMSGESIPELIPELDNDADEREHIFDLYEQAYSDGYVLSATWADSDDDEPAPINPFDADAR